MPTIRISRRGATIRRLPRHTARWPKPAKLHAIANWAACLVVGLAAITIGEQVRAGTPVNVGQFRNWMAVMLQESGDKFCYVHGIPVRKRGKVARRGETYVQIVQLPLPRDRHTDELLLTAGYPYLENSTVTLNIDGKKYRLVTQEDTAWTHDVKIDPGLVRRMKKGRRMVIRGRSDNGTVTTDTYSLHGFSAAYRAAAKACGTK